MPKRLTRIAVYISMGDQHGDSASYVWYDSCGNHHWPQNKDEVATLQKEGYLPGVRQSVYSHLHIQLTTKIHNQEIEEVIKILKRNFIYPGLVSPRENPQNDHSKGEWYETGYETYYTRPVIEALFFDRPEVFHTLIDAVLDSNHQNLYSAFSECLAGTDLNPDMLFRWDFASQQAVTQEIEEIRRHGEKLSADTDNLSATAKGADAVQLAASLAAKVAAKPANVPANDREKFENLKFKLELLLQLHSKDNAFAIHRGYKRCVTNILTFTFSAGAANLINRAVSGKWLFFNKTTTEEKVDKVQAKLGFSPEVKVSL